MFARIVTMAGTAALLLLTAAPAQAAYPGENGKLAFDGVYTMNSDGTGVTHLTPGSAPSWSPDGTRIAFATNRDANWEIYVMNGDGSAQQRLTSNPAVDTAPSWSPDQQRIVFQTNRDGNDELYVMNADGTVQSRITNTPDPELGPKWSPDGARIAFNVYASTAGIYTIRPDGSGRTFHHNGEGPNWAPNGYELWSWDTYYDEFLEDYYNQFQILNLKTGGVDVYQTGTQDHDPVISPANNAVVALTGDGRTYVESNGSHLLPGGPWIGADWQPVHTPSTHIRPAAAATFRVSLVPAYQCNFPNREHGPPLAFPSCAPPPRSSRLTVGVGDGSPALSRSVGYLRIAVLRGVPGGVDDTDARIRFSLTNVMRVSDLSEYTGELRASAQVRLTDRGGAVAQTTEKFPLEFDVPCVPTAPTIDKSLCDLTTTLDSVIPGAAAEGTRAVWALDQLKVYDGGPDEDASTTADNSLFAVQGVFVP